MGRVQGGLDPVRAAAPADVPLDSPERLNHRQRPLATRVGRDDWAVTTVLGRRPLPRRRPGRCGAGCRRRAGRGLNRHQPLKRVYWERCCSAWSVGSGSPAGSNGFRQGAPVGAMWCTFRVTTVIPCTSAVAARRPSMSGRGSGMPSRPHRSATAASTSTMRSLNRARVLSSHERKAIAEAGSRRSTRSVPRRSSPNVRTLRKSSSGVRSSIQERTSGLARWRLRSSEITLVSTRYFTVQRRAARSAAGRSRHRLRPRASRGDDR